LEGAGRQHSGGIDRDEVAEVVDDALHVQVAAAGEVDALRPHAGLGNAAPAVGKDAAAIQRVAVVLDRCTGAHARLPKPVTGSPVKRRGAALSCAVASTFAASTERTSASNWSSGMSVQSMADGPSSAGCAHAKTPFCSAKRKPSASKPWGPLTAAPDREANG